MPVGSTTAQGVSIPVQYAKHFSPLRSGCPQSARAVSSPLPKPPATSSPTAFSRSQRPTSPPAPPSAMPPASISVNTLKAMPRPLLPRACRRPRQRRAARKIKTARLHRPRAEKGDASIAKLRAEELTAFRTWIQAAAKDPQLAAATAPAPSHRSHPAA